MRTGVVAMVAATMLLAGCRTKTVVEERVVPEVHYVDRVQVLRDSVWLRDSVFQTEFLRGDTVVRYKYRQKVQYVERLAHDTVVRVDSVPVEVRKTIVKTKTDYRGWWAFGGLLLVVAGAAVIVRTRLRK